MPSIIGQGSPQILGQAYTALDSWLDLDSRLYLYASHAVYSRAGLPSNSRASFHECDQRPPFLTLDHSPGPYKPYEGGPNRYTSGGEGVGQAGSSTYYGMVLRV